MEVSVTPFKFKHYDMLLSMLKDQKCTWQSIISYKTLPKIGYIALLDNQPIATGFLRKVEGGYAQLDTFATNPYFGSQIRHIGIELVWQELLKEIKILDLLGVIAITEDLGILSRAQQHGFSIPAHSLLVNIID